MFSRKLKRLVYTFKSTDWSALKSILTVEDLNNCISNAGNVDETWKYWLSFVKGALDKSVSKIIRDSTSLPWIDKEVRGMSRLKIKAWRKATQSNMPSHWASFRILRNNYINTIITKHSRLSDSIRQNPKRSWLYFRSKTKSKTFPQFVCHANRCEDTAVGKACLFKDYFKSVFSHDSDLCLPTIVEESDNILTHVQFTSFGVYQVQTGVYQTGVYQVCIRCVSGVYQV